MGTDELGLDMDHAADRILGHRRRAAPAVRGQPPWKCQVCGSAQKLTYGALPVVPAAPGFYVDHAGATHQCGACKGTGVREGEEKPVGAP